MISTLFANLPVDRIEPSADFFAKIGFEVTVQVPEGDHMGFAILANGNQQLMFQTRTSILEDTPTMADAAAGGPALIYVRVPDVKAVADALEGYDVILNWRETFYGAKEIGFREPGGHHVTFAQFAEEE